MKSSASEPGLTSNPTEETYIGIKEKQKDNASLKVTLSTSLLLSAAVGHQTNIWVLPELSACASRRKPSGNMFTNSDISCFTNNKDRQ